MNKNTSIDKVSAVLCNTGYPQLRELFQRHGADVSTVDWESLPPGDPVPLRCLKATLRGKDWESLDIVQLHIASLSTKLGSDLLEDLIKERDANSWNQLNILPQNRYTRAAFASLFHSEIFYEAVELYYILESRWLPKRIGLPKGITGFDTEKQKKLEIALNEYLVSRKRTGNIVIQTREYKGIHYVVATSGPSLNWCRGESRQREYRKIERQFIAAFAYDPESGDNHFFCNDKRISEKVEDLFHNALLDQSVKRIPLPTYDLSFFKERDIPTTTAPSDHVELMFNYFEMKDRYGTVIQYSQRGGEPLERLKENFREEAIADSQTVIEAIGFRFISKSCGCRKAVTFTICNGNECDLSGDQSEAELAIIRKYLCRWGVISEDNKTFPCQQFEITEALKPVPAGAK